MSVKIFLPNDLFYIKINCDLYGEIKINENNAISYFIIAHHTTDTPNEGTTKAEDFLSNLRHLGHITRAGPITEEQRRDVAISFLYDSDTPNIYVNKLSIQPTESIYANIFLYNTQRILQLNDNITNETKSTSISAGDYKTEQCDDVRMLLKILKNYENRKNKKTQQKTTLYNYLFISAKFLFDLMTKIFVLLMEWQPIVFLIQHTFLYNHFREWRKFNASSSQKLNIALDKVLGIIVMIILLFFISNPEEYVISASNIVIDKLRLLLHALKGSPIGLKLNVHLNNFFLDCFSYHIDLWATFLTHIEPFVHQLFMPIALLGSMGLSYQLALLADLISVVGLHAHCFYIYAAVLYKVEVKGLQVLWKLVLGKRYNILKKRVEAHNYMKRQLYLATLFFTSLLFLFPTILVYYIVFTSLRLCIFLLSLLLQIKRRRILEFPLRILFKWLTGNYFELEGLQLLHMNHAPSPLLQTKVRMSVFKLNVLSSSLSRVFLCKSGVLQELAISDQMSFKNILNRILSGKF